MQNPSRPFPPHMITSLLMFLKYYNSCQRLRGNHGTTAALQAFPFVKPTNGASWCGFVSVRVCACDVVASHQREPGTVSRTEVPFSFFSLCFIFAIYMVSDAAAVCLYHTASFRRCGSHVTTVAVLQGIRFVPATNGASVCVRVCVLCGHATPNTTRDSPNPHFLLVSRACAQYSSGTTAAAAAVQHQ